MRIIVAASNGKSLVDFRGNLVKDMIAKGHEVYCISCEDDDVTRSNVEALGAKYEYVPMSRTGTNFIQDIKTIGAFKKAIKKIEPDMYFAFMSKPVAYGGTAARQCKVKHINVLVNGLEIAFYRKGFKSALIRQVLKLFYGYVHKGCDNVFFQNSDDLGVFKKMGIVTDEQATVVNGSGVDMTRFEKTPIPKEPVALMVARLVWSKGIREYLKAAQIVKEKMPQARFMLVGGLDKNQESLTKEELDKYIGDSIIEYQGFADDVRPYLEKCSMFVLPSYHEGTPRSVLEAMACGRAIVTTNAPGCRETVKDGYNGYIAEVMNAEDLADKILKICKDDMLRAQMGDNSYTMCCEKYDVKLVNKSMLDKMKL